MNQNSAAETSVDLPEEIKDVLAATTTRIVNRAIEQRVERVVSVDRRNREIGERLWRPSMLVLLGIFVAAFIWLVIGVLH
jgi:hypothetical protein